jgi:hypothetical protein
LKNRWKASNLATPRRGLISIQPSRPCPLLKDASNRAIACSADGNPQRNRMTFVSTKLSVIETPAMRAIKGVEVESPKIVSPACVDSRNIWVIYDAMSKYRL